MAESAGFGFNCRISILLDVEDPAEAEELAQRVLEFVGALRGGGGSAEEPLDHMVTVGAGPLAPSIEAFLEELGRESYAVFVPKPEGKT